MSRTKFLGTPDWKTMFEDAEAKIAELEELLDGEVEISKGLETKIAELEAALRGEE